MRDSFLLLGAGVIFASLGWAFWHYLGSDAPAVLAALALVAVTADNFRLRRQLRQRGTE